MIPRATVYQHYLHLRVLGPQWATGATKWIIHERHVGWAIVDLLDPHWALRATIWTTCRSRSFLSFWVISELQEPLYITSCRSRHFMSSESPVSHRSHCMNHRYIYVFAGFLCPQWAVGATVWTTGKLMSLQAFWVPSESYEPLYEPRESLAICACSASPVSHRSHYLNHM